MSFLRPEIAATVRLWREPLGWGAVALLGVVVIATGHAGLGPLIVGGLLTGIGLVMVAGAVRRTRLGAESPEAGVVTVDEGRIAYFGPIEGGVLGLSALARVEVAAGDWVLTGAEGTQLRIPRGALGADALPDALAPLPGLDLARAVEAFRTARPFPVTIWQAAQTVPALGRPPPRR
jgi:hypothetical protein